MLPPRFFRGQLRIPVNPKLPVVPVTPAPTLVQVPHIPAFPTKPLPRKLTKWERKAEAQRLMAFKYTLDLEHERRYRKGMTILLEEIMEYEKMWGVGFEDERIASGVVGGKKGRSKVGWKDGVDVEHIKRT